MSDSPDAIRADIEQTRRELGSDVDALADKVSPSKIVDRQADKVKQAFGSVRDRVMGAADDAGIGAVATPDATVGDVKDRVVAKAEGNPLAVGLIAFGAGLLLASLIPASTKEKELAADVKEQAAAAGRRGDRCRQRGRRATSRNRRRRPPPPSRTRQRTLSNP